MAPQVGVGGAQLARRGHVSRLALKFDRLPNTSPLISLKPCETYDTGRIEWVASSAGRVKRP
eukprot:5520380-Prymnesium_polylepis.1